MLNCPIKKYTKAYKAAEKKVVDINPGAPTVPLQLGVNAYWLSLESNPMTDVEKQVYRVLTESTDGLARINMSYTTQIHEKVVMVKDIGKAYTVYLLSGKNYTFDKGSKTSIPTAKGRTVEMPYMVLSNPRQGKMGSDENVGIGTKKGDVKVGEEEIDLGQVLTDEFEAYLSFDEQEGRPIQTQEFRDLQDKVLKTYQETMQNLETGNVKIEMFESSKEATAGQIDLKSRELKMRWNNMSRLSRISEVFLHEVNHLMSSHVFKDNIKLRRLMEDLRDNAINWSRL